MFLQVKTQHAYTNGSASATATGRAKAGRAPAKETSALVRAACLDHATGVGIAVSHINEGKLNEAMEILDYIISATTGPHNTGAHIARGTARAMLRDLGGITLAQACLQYCSRRAVTFAGPCAQNVYLSLSAMLNICDILFISGCMSACSAAVSCKHIVLTA